MDTPSQPAQDSTGQRKATPTVAANKKPKNKPNQTQKTAPVATPTEAPIVPTAAPPVAVIEGQLLEDMDGMIATAAYYLAERRNFAPGHELEDWLEAEQQIRK
jgi:hypothetical protein